MDVRPLRQVVALADAGNFRKAAEQLDITHSALSQAIAKIEASYGLELFSRQHRKTVPTPFGQRLVEAAREALRVMDEAERDIGLMRNLEAGRLVIGADPTLSEALLAPALTSLLKTYPKLRFTVLSRNWATMEEDLRARRIDLFVGLEPDRRGPGIDYTAIKLAPPVVACRPGHPLVRQGRDITIDDIVAHPLVGGEVPNWFLNQVQTAYPDTFANRDALEAAFLTSHDLGLVRRLLLASDAIGLVPFILVGEDVKAKRLKIITPEWSAFDGPLPGVIAKLEDRPLPPPAQKLSDKIKSLTESAGWS